jgi:quercetin dioxygenase-like cupin family protein
MTIKSPINVPPGGGKATNVIGNAVTVKIHGRDTGGAFSVIETQDKPNEGPPLHIQGREDEMFFVLEGEYEFTCGALKFTGKAGNTALLPKGVPHRYQCISPTSGRMLVVISPAGFEDFFIDASGVTDVARVVEIAKKYGLEILPPA